MTLSTGSTAITANRWALARLVLPLILVLSASCGNTGETFDESEDVGEVSEPITVGKNLIASSTAARETSVAVDQVTGKAVIAHINSSGVGSPNAWASSSNWNLASGVWASHNAADVGQWPTILASDGTPFGGYFGDPIVLALGGDKFIYISLMKSANHVDPWDVVAAVSTDGGLTFTNTKLISDANTSNADQPVAAYDAATGDIWVWWRRPVQGESYLRKIKVNAGAITYLTNPIKVVGFNLPVTDIQNANIAYGTVGTISQKVYLVYATAAAKEVSTCPNIPANQTTTYWLSWVADPATQLWQTSMIGQADTAWPFCVGPGRVSNVYGVNRTRPQFVFGTNACFVTLTRHVGTPPNDSSVVEV
jgi:hypothetical protein